MERYTPYYENLERTIIYFGKFIFVIVYSLETLVLGTCLWYNYRYIYFSNPLLSMAFSCKGCISIVDPIVGLLAYFTKCISWCCSPYAFLTFTLFPASIVDWCIFYAFFWILSNLYTWYSCLSIPFPKTLLS